MASMGYSRENRFQPPAKLLSKTAVTGFSYLTPVPQQQQRLPVVRSLSHAYGSGYNSLPRSRPNTSGPTSLSHARRKMVNSALQDYLKSLNSMTRSIVLETETVEKENKYNWTQLDAAKKEDLVNAHFMPADVRMQYDSERAASCCSFTSALSLERGSASHQDLGIHREKLVVENRPLHLSQPSEWEEVTNHKKQMSRSSRDLVYANEWSANVSQGEDLSLSQPSIPSSLQESAEKTNFNRLHKKQLSFRPSHKHAVKPRQLQPLPPQSSFRSQLGSDGDSPRTSDEDFEGFGQPQNPLGFQRSKLRSYSMRSKRGNGSLRNSVNLRSSVRTSNRIRTSPDKEQQPLVHDPQHCRPSHSHSYSTNSTETDFDEAIDMPDDSLLLDHVSRKSSTDETFDGEYQSQKTPKYNRARRSLRSMPKIMLEQSEVHINHSLCSDATQSNSSFSSSVEGYLVNDSSAGDGSDLYRPPSRDSLDDLDSISMAPSDASKYPMDDEDSITDQSRMTPDSILSLSSSYSCRPRSKNSELAVLRNRRGNRGGSYIKVSTSDFADRHTQFKNNLSPKHGGDASYPTSVCTTRATSPASSISSVAINWPNHEQDSTGHLKAPSFSYGSSKHDSAAESMLSGTPCSPSGLYSPPSTPLAVNYTANSHLFRKALSSPHYDDRESGYISSSSESFPVASRR